MTRKDIEDDIVAYAINMREGYIQAALATETDDYEDGCTKYQRALRDLFASVDELNSTTETT